MPVSEQQKEQQDTNIKLMHEILENAQSEDNFLAHSAISVFAETMCLIEKLLHELRAIKGSMEVTGRELIEIQIQALNICIDALTNVLNEPK